MKLGLVTVAACAAFAAAAPAHAASSPLPWCGTPSAVDRIPDATSSYAIHVAYVRAPGEPDRFSQWAPRIVGDVASIDAWWRREDPTRALRFDLFPNPGCDTPFAALDLTAVQLSQPISGITNAFRELRLLLASEAGFRSPEKAYLVYFDGPTGQIGRDRVCGQGARGGFGLPGLAVVYLDSCTASEGDSLRPVVAVHELVHVLNAVDDAAPNVCRDGHVCDAGNDLMGSSLTGVELESLVLDAGRNDYYGHGNRWPDVRNSFFLDRLDSPDVSPPVAPAAFRAGDDPSGLTRLSWRPSADDVGPVTYRVYQDGQFLREIAGTTLLVTSTLTGIDLYAVRAVDGVGRLSPIVVARFREGVGMVDVAGMLVRDTVRPGAVPTPKARSDAKTVRLSWRAPTDAGGIRSYRVKIGKRTVIVRRPAIAIARSRLAKPVTIAAVDRAGNIGPATTVPARLLR